MDWIASDTRDLWSAPLTAVGVYAVLIVATRLSGLRSFFKMSGFDFAMTLAIGVAGGHRHRGRDHLPGRLPSAWQHLPPPVARWRVARGNPLSLRWTTSPASSWTGLQSSRRTSPRPGSPSGDVRAKLREADVPHPSQMRAVVTTGDISGLHTPDLDEAFQADLLLDGLRRGAAG